jgi:hypothetical protein
VAQTTSGTHLSTIRLILVPALITLAVTILRLVGELQHWSNLLFNPNAGGGFALVGIVWLPIIFGPYFGLKLSGAGEAPSGAGKAIGFALLGLVLVIGGAMLAFGPKPQFPGKMLLGLLIVAAGAALQFLPWPALAKTLVAYGYAARIPVAILMFFAIQGNWGTHYDALPSDYSGPTSLWGKYFAIGLVPQLVFWVAFTVAFGSLFGAIITAIVRRGKPALQTAT